MKSHAYGNNMGRAAGENSKVLLRFGLETVMCAKLSFTGMKHMASEGKRLNGNVIWNNVRQDKRTRR
jgi:hypothetical protein